MVREGKAEAIDGLDLENIETDELRDMMREHRDAAVRALVQEAAPAPVAGFSAVPARQLVVPTSKAQGYVSQGWRYVHKARLPEGQALIEASSTTPVLEGDDVAVVAHGPSIRTPSRVMNG